jgi:hemoglobin-like flavoprotein
MLGPDMDLVEEQLQHLGITHIQFQVEPKHYPLMGKALEDTIQAKLGGRFTENYKKSWNTIYTFMSTTMLQGAFGDLKRQVRSN